jgi:hypothetical protein
MVKRVRGKRPSCEDVGWLNDEVRREVMRILRRIEEKTGDSKLAVGTLVASALAQNAAALMCVLTQTESERGRRIAQEMHALLESFCDPA